VNVCRRDIGMIENEGYCRNVLRGLMIYVEKEMWTPTEATAKRFRSTSFGFSGTILTPKSAVLRENGVEGARDKFSV